MRREGVHLLQGYYIGRPMLDRPWLKGGSNSGLVVPLPEPAAAKPQAAKQAVGGV